MKIGDRSLLSDNPKNDDLSTRLWRLSYQSFTLKELHQQMAGEWGIPIAQLEIAVGQSFEQKTKLRLPEGTSIIWPVSP